MPERLEEKLKLLSIGYYGTAVVVGILAFSPLIIALTWGRMLGEVEAPTDGSMSPFPLIWFMAIASILITLIMGAMSYHLARAGKCLAKQTRYRYCVIVGAFSCLVFPIGLVLGPLTWMILTQDGVEETFSTPTKTL